MTGAAERNHGASFTRRAVAVRQHHIRSVLRVDDDMPGFGNQFAEGDAARHIHGIDGNAQPRRWREFAGRIAHAACRSAIVVCTVIT